MTMNQKAVELISPAGEKLLKKSGPAHWANVPVKIGQAATPSDLPKKG